MKTKSHSPHKSRAPLTHKRCCSHFLVDEWHRDSPFTTKVQLFMKIIYSSLISNECFCVILTQQFTRWQNKWFSRWPAQCLRVNPRRTCLDSIQVSLFIVDFICYHFATSWIWMKKFRFIFQWWNHRSATSHLKPKFIVLFLRLENHQTMVIDPKFILPLSWNDCQLKTFFQD